ncbi:chlorophyll a/b-binding protein [Prochlorococcus marinus]|uniref:chlorophyll a/b-binding protein n=1 Tax=Prochlorococcus marinus TaxID=1219 RepID=UPI0022B2E1F8|nr:chlorophyll a/b-binding protein [Prochlorococcus marinus]
MNSNTETNQQDNQSIEQEKTDSEITNHSPSATTNDVPEFGWSGYAERINGRFAMIGLMAVLLVEAISKISFLEWAGIINK